MHGQADENLHTKKNKRKRRTKLEETHKNESCVHLTAWKKTCKDDYAVDFLYAFLTVLYIFLTLLYAFCPVLYLFCSQAFLKKSFIHFDIYMVSYNRVVQLFLQTDQFQVP